MVRPSRPSFLLFLLIRGLCHVDVGTVEGGAQQNYNSTQGTSSDSTPGTESDASEDYLSRAPPHTPIIILPLPVDGKLAVRTFTR